MTRKACSLALALAVVALGSVAQAAKSRTDTGEYNTVVVDPVTDPPSASGGITNTVRFMPKKGERFVSVVLEDQSGRPAMAVLGQDLDGDGNEDTEHEICGATEAPIAFKPGKEISVSALEGTCGGEPSVSTFGTVTATFTR